MWTNSAQKGDPKWLTLVNISAHHFQQILFICLILSPVDATHSWAPPAPHDGVKAKINSLAWHKVHFPAEPFATFARLLYGHPPLIVKDPGKSSGFRSTLKDPLSPRVNTEDQVCLWLHSGSQKTQEHSKYLPYKQCMFSIYNWSRVGFAA